MHRLHLLRHAKSGWDNDLDDLERPLSKRGREAARLIGKTLPAAIGALDLVLCSTAVRTRETADLALAGFRPTPHILVEDGLYLATAAAIMARLSRVGETCGTVMVIGHNPGLQELAALLVAPGSKSGAAITDGKFPTGVRASFEIDSAWANLGHTRHHLINYVTV